jgi:anthranilate phosphoribosyltransferase
MSDPNTLKSALGALVSGAHLTENESEAAVGAIMEGAATPAQIGAFLTALRMRGETTDELVGAARAMRARVVPVPHDLAQIVDTCGTGGDGAKTFNISTATAFVVAAAGLPVAKHGNRAVSSSVGSADVLEALGVSINLTPEAVSRCLREVGLGFMFAPNHHQAMKHAAPVRRELGFRTMFNLLGPVTNPANATHQLIGIFDGSRLMQVATVLLRLGVKRALVVHGPAGLDELGLDGITRAVLVDHGELKPLEIDPTPLVTAAPVSTLAGGDAGMNAAIIRDVLAGTPGPAREVVALNAGAALWVAEAASTLADGVGLARDILEKGLARERLESFASLTRSLGGAA